MEKTLCCPFTTRLIFAVALLATSSALPALAQENATSQETRDRVQNIFETAYDNICRGLMPEADGTTLQPRIYELSFRYYEEDKLRPYTIYEYLCFQGPYNEGFVYYGVDEYLEVKQMQFARPAFDLVEFEGEDEGRSEKIKITGFETTNQLINASFNSETGIIYSNYKWRGLGDAFSVGKWVFEKGQFILKSYDVDPSFNGERRAQRIYGPGEAPDYN